MPTRRTSPRRSATGPGGLHERSPEPTFGEIVDDDPEIGFLASAAPWLALLALVLAVAAAGYVFFTRSSAGDLAGDPTACRSAAWAAVPAKKSLPTDWSLGSTDLNANGMTISILGPAPADSSTNQPVVYASVTCYGDAAATALAEYRKASEAAGATVRPRSSHGDAYDVDNPTTGALTTLFRVGPLVGQIADGGSSSPEELATITSAVAAAMGDKTAAGTASLAGPTDAAAGSEEPVGSGDVGAEPSGTPFAPELEALLPKSISSTASAASPSVPVPLTIQSASATEVFGEDPSSRALAARIRALGATLDQLQIAQAYDDTGAIDLSIIAFRLPNADLAKLRAAITDTWLSAGATGVKSTTINLGGKNLTKVDYGDGSTIEYVYSKDDYVIVIDTSDASVATQVATQLK
jgi:hypothetical protein